MAFDQELAIRIRVLVAGEPGLFERKMFGGLAFMFDGNIAVGISNDDRLMVRVHPDDLADALGRPHARPFDMSGRLLNGWVAVDKAGIEDDATLTEWVRQGVTYARSLPPK